LLSFVYTIELKIYQMKGLLKENSKFLALFLISVLSLVLPAFVLKEHLSDLIFSIIFSVMVLASTFTIAETKRHHKKIFIIGATTLAFSWLLFLDVLPLNRPLKLGGVPFFFFFIYTVYRLVHTILKSTEVTPDVIFGAVTGYIFLGYAGTFYFEIIRDIFPNSFDAEAIQNPMSLIYYSFVTMTTLGFGDITPLSNPARSGTIVLTILGQFYIATVVAILVSKYIAGSSNK